MFKKRFPAAAAVVAIAAGLVTGAGPASAVATRVIGASDIVALPGTVNGYYGNATYAFSSDGLQINVPNPDTDYAVLHWTDGGLLKDVHTVDYDWTGSATRPGIKYDVDVDGDGSVDCELVGEQAYDGTDGTTDGVTHDVWLNKDQDDFPGSDFYDDEFPVCEFAAPSHTSGSGATDDYDSSHGNLDAWAARFAAFNDWWCDDGGPVYDAAVARPRFREGSCDNDEPVVVDTGVGASGLAQSGVLHSVTVGPNKYIFGVPSTPSSNPQGTATARTADVTGSYVAKQHAHKVVITLNSDATPSGFVAGKNLVWTYTVGKSAPVTVTQTAGKTDTVTATQFRDADRAGNHLTVRLYKNGVKVGVFSVLPRPRHKHHHSG